MFVDGEKIQKGSMTTGCSIHFYGKNYLTCDL